VNLDAVEFFAGHAMIHSSLVRRGKVSVAYDINFTGPGPHSHKNRLGGG